jgi:hypothetical protein
LIDGAATRRALDRRLGALAIVAGSAAALGLQLVLPVGVPLYDGVVVQEPYRYLDPTGDQAGSPTSFSATLPVTGSESPAFVASTEETPPQAQLIAQADAFQLPAGTTSISVAITPVEPPPVPPPSPIAGNVYLVSVTAEDGTPLPTTPCDGCLTLYVRAPEETGAARLLRLAGGEWIDVDAIHVPTTGMYAWNATGLGAFAIVSVPDAGGATELLVAGGAVILLLLGVAGVLVMRRRAPPATAGRQVARRGTGRLGASGASGRAPGVRTRGIPSKRKGPRRPPSGRSDR